VEGGFHCCPICTFQSHLVFLHRCRLAAFTLRSENFASQRCFHGRSADTSASSNFVFIEGHTDTILCSFLPEILLTEILGFANVCNIRCRNTFRTAFVFYCLRFESLWTSWTYRRVDCYLWCFSLWQTWVANKLTSQFLTPFFPSLSYPKVFSFMEASRAH